MATAVPDLSRLKPAGGKRSSKRERIVNVFLRQEGHLSADDLVDLAAASPILARQVLQGGRCVFGSKAPALARFEATLVGRYEDLKRVRAEAERALVQRVIRGRS